MLDRSSPDKTHWKANLRRNANKYKIPIADSLFMQSKIVSKGKI